MATTRVQIAQSNRRNILTKKQLDTLQHAANGLNNKEIASLYNVTTFAIRNRFEYILNKLYAQTRTQAVAIGFRNGLLK